MCFRLPFHCCQQLSETHVAFVLHAALYEVQVWHGTSLLIKRTEHERSLERYTKRLETISIPDGFFKRLELSFFIIARDCSPVQNKNPEFFAQWCMSKLPDSFSQRSFTTSTQCGQLWESFGHYDWGSVESSNESFFQCLPESLW